MTNIWTNGGPNNSYEYKMSMSGVDLSKALVFNTSGETLKCHVRTDGTKIACFGVEFADYTTAPRGLEFRKILVRVNQKSNSLGVYVYPDLGDGDSLQIALKSQFKALDESTTHTYAIKDGKVDKLRGMPNRINLVRNGDLLGITDPDNCLPDVKTFMQELMQHLFHISPDGSEDFLEDLLSIVQDDTPVQDPSVQDATHEYLDVPPHRRTSITRKQLLDQMLTNSR